MPFFPADELRSAASGRWTEILCSNGLPGKILDGRNHPCPKCGGRDRFAAFGDVAQRGAVHCRHCFTRGSLIAPSDGIATLRWWLGLDFNAALRALADSIGWVLADSNGRVSADSMGGTTTHGRRSSQAGFAGPSLDHRGPIPLARMRQEDLPDELIASQTRFAKEAFRRMTAPVRNRLARSLRVSVTALYELRVGVTSAGRCSCWPMRDGKGRVIGIRLATLPWSEGPPGKWARRSSKSGLFAPQPTAFRSTDRSDHLFVTEGASDTAAAITAGAWAVGRASCNAPPAPLIDYLLLQRPQVITLIADNDAPGRRGAFELERSLREYCPGIRSLQTIVPPDGLSDLREWVARGAGPEEWCDSPPLRPPSESRQRTFEFARR